MKTLTKYLLSAISFLLCSCDKDEVLSPPEKGGHVFISIQLPKSLEMLPLKVIYRSNLCQKIKTDGLGSSYKVPGFKTMNLALKNGVKDKEYKIPIPRSIGGDCEWKLSNLTLIFKSTLDNGISDNVPISEVVIFDNNPPQRLSGSYLDVNGNLDLTDDYFPIVTTYHISGFKKVESILRSSPDKMYRMINGGGIFFHPRFHFEKTIYAVEPKEQKVGEYMSIIYPDGTIESSPFFS